MIQALRILLAAAMVCVFATGSLAAKSLRQVDIHDPAIAEDNGIYYLFSTGPGITFYSSKDMVHWVLQGRIFPSAPVWARSVASNFDGHIWAPDISRHNGRFYLYYSVSGFGKNDSAIGLTINKTLNPDSPNYKWVDQGIVIRSVAGRDLWNAIDPNLIVDDHGTPWMAFGSFWSGIKLVKLNKTMTAPAEPQEWYSIAKRYRPPFMDDKKAGPAQIEGPFIFKHGDYYYLFVSTGLCCRGKNSTYRIAFGRSKDITGPYLDEKSRDMGKGGGTPLLKENRRWAGWGGESVYDFNGKDYIVFHAYENADNNFHRLKIAQIKWNAAQWPTVDGNTLDSYRGFLVKK